MKITPEEFDLVTGHASTGECDLDLAEVVRSAIEEGEVAPGNSDLLEKIRQVRIDRDHAIAEYNEHSSGLYTGSVVYSSDVERVECNRAVAGKSIIWNLQNSLPRMLLGSKREQAEQIVRESIAGIEGIYPEFDASVYRATSVREEEHLESEPESKPDI
jgi:hypothetical protein